MKDFEKFEDLTAKIFQALNDKGFKVTKNVVHCSVLHLRT